MMWNSGNGNLYIPKSNVNPSLLLKKRAIFISIEG
jgi:hypothetical protein